MQRGCRMASSQQTPSRRPPPSITGMSLQTRRIVRCESMQALIAIRDIQQGALLACAPVSGASSHPTQVKKSPSAI